MADVIVDTDILIDVACNLPDAIGYIHRLEQWAHLGISHITYNELLMGCRSKMEQRKVERFMRRFELIKLNKSITDQAITLLEQYRLSHSLLIANGLIAATALVLGKPLASKNQCGYQFINGLILLSYP